MTTTVRPRFPLAGLRHATLLALALGTGACTYIETQMQRQPVPDTRITLGWQDRLSLAAREIPNYRCEGRLFLSCERGGSITYSCTCASN